MYNSFLKAIFVLSVMCLCNTTLAKASRDTAKMVERIEHLEHQVKLLEERVPKRIRKLPLDLPHLSTNGAIQESVSRLESMFNINFIQYHQQITQNRRFCTKDAFQEYTNFLKKTKWIENIVDTKSLLYVFPDGSPKVITEGSKDKRYAWMIQVPLKVSIENNKDKTEQPIIVTLTIQRASELVHPAGMLITDMRFKETG
tara:strand:- start:13452 stop:14051 length:600 start_codon:yes stop_codon:yes gene_type:complete